MSDNSSAWGWSALPENKFIETINWKNTTANISCLISNLANTFKNLDLSKAIEININQEALENILLVLVSLNNDINWKMALNYKFNISKNEILRSIKMLVLSLNQSSYNVSRNYSLLEDNQYKILYNAIELIDNIERSEVSGINEEVSKIINIA